jgi:hypothetical protein
MKGLRWNHDGRGWAGLNGAAVGRVGVVAVRSTGRAAGAVWVGGAL